MRSEKSEICRAKSETPHSFGDIDRWTAQLRSMANQLEGLATQTRQAVW